MTIRYNELIPEPHWREVILFSVYLTFIGIMFSVRISSYRCWSLKFPSCWRCWTSSTLRFRLFRRDSTPHWGFQIRVLRSSWRLWQHAKIFVLSVVWVPWVNRCSSGAHLYSQRMRTYLQDSDRASRSKHVEAEKRLFTQTSF